VLKPETRVLSVVAESRYAVAAGYSQAGLTVPVVGAVHCLESHCENPQAVGRHPEIRLAGNEEFEFLAIQMMSEFACKRI